MENNNMVIRIYMIASLISLPFLAYVIVNL